MAEHHDTGVRTEHVVLDIGGDIGALVLLTGPELLNAEIEMTPKGSHDGHFHNQVHQREFNGHSVFAAVYPQIKAGEYDIWKDESTVAGSVAIVGGQVTTVDWRTAS